MKVHDKKRVTRSKGGYLPYPNFGVKFLIFKNDFIERVNTHRQLGVYLTSNLDWSFQINDICLKANRKLSVLRNVKMLKRKTLDLLYKIIVRSVIDYALPLYGNNLKKLT